MSIAPDPLPQDVRDALSRGNVIEAIKGLRQAKGLGLKEAKDAIDAHMHGNPRSMPTASAGYTGALPQSVQLALQGGNKIEAIRLLREATGLGLKEARDAVESSQQGAKLPPNSLAPGEMTGKSGFVWWVVGAIAMGAAAYLLLRANG